MKRAWTLTALVATGVVTLGGGFFAGRAWAGGIPATSALTYSGTLEDATGAALTGSHNIQVNFWSAATGGTTPVCQTGPTATALDSGRFSVALPDTCTTSVKGNPNVWVEVIVDGSSLGRTKVGAVPYAVEAGHATAADTATTATSATNVFVAGGVSGASLKLNQATFTVDNANTARSVAAPGELAWGYGLIPTTAIVIGVAYQSGLKDGCEVTPSVNVVHATGSTRILVEIDGFSGQGCADVGQLTFSYVYLSP